MCKYLSLTVRLTVSQSMQAVLAAVKVLCMRFPTVRYHAGTALLAVGRLPSCDPSAGSAGPLANDEPLAVWDMETGAKKRSLLVRCTCSESTDDQRCPLLLLLKGNLLVV